MIKPETVSDETLEYAAQLIERASFIDIAGVAARRKRDREDAALRAHARKELRAEMADHLRAMKGRPELSPEAALDRIAERVSTGCDMVLDLKDAWPLAWKGWLHIYVMIRCNDNSVPPETHYCVILTDAGKAVLEARRGNIHRAALAKGSGPAASLG